MDTPGFQFQSEQQRKIYEDLLLFGDGPAAFFKDACRLIEEQVPYETTTHLVGHLLREIKSAIEAVLTPPSNASDTESDDSNTTKKVLRYLGFCETDWVFLFATRLNRDPHIGLAKMAHRHQLNFRSRDQVFDQFWGEVQEFLEQLLDKARDRLLDLSRPVESIAEKDNPTDDDINTLRTRLPHNPVFLRRFFDKIQSPHWLNLLDQADYFDAPPPRIERDGSLQFVTWPQSAFLVRIAGQVPERVRDTILKIPFTDNDTIVSDFAEAALAMPATVAEPVVEKIVDWIEDRETLYLVEPIAKNISHMASGGLDTTAFKLAAAVLHLEPRAGTDVMPLDRAPKLRIDSYLYNQIIREQLLPLGKKYTRRTLHMLCKLLDRALPPTERVDSTLEGEWEVFHYRESISGDAEYSDLMFANVLIDAVRDVSRYSDDVQHTIADTCSVLDSYSREIFRRINLHTLANATDPPSANIKAALLHPDIFEKPRIWPEVAELLSKQFATLKSTEKNLILSWIARGPKGPWPEANDAGRDAKIRYWKFEKLQPIRDHLSTMWKEKYENLAAEFEVEILERKRLRELSEGWEISPIEKDEFSQKRVEEIVSYIQNWTPGPEDHPRASRTSLVRMLEELVADKPVRFADHTDILADLDSDVLSHIFSGLMKALGEKREFDWGNVINLCQSSLDRQQNTDDSESAEHDRWMKQVIAQLIEAGLKNPTHPIPHEFREEVLTILTRLTQDVDPSPEREANREESFGGAWSLAINSVRGYAICALFEYAKWTKPTNGDSDMLRSLPSELWTFIESYVEDCESWNRTNHVVIGCWLPVCLHADENKTIAMLPAIFPEDDLTGHLFDAAWEGYIMHWQPHKHNFTTFKSAYRHAVEKLPKTSGKQVSESWSPPGHLARHLFAFYGWGIIDFGENDSLLDTFFDKAPLEVRINALQWVGRLTWKDDEDDDDRNSVLQRYQDMFERRITFYENKTDASVDASELESFGRWVISPYYEDGWCLKQLQRVLKIVGRVRSDTQVLQHFETLVHQYPLPVLSCVQLMLEQTKDEWAPLRWHRRIRKILENAKQSSDADVNEEVRRMINRMAAQGMGGFDDLLD